MVQQKSVRLRPVAKALVDSLRQFLTPAVWKQGHQALGRHRHGLRWDIQPLVLVLAVSAWCCGDSQPERFEAARAVCVLCRPKQRRPGQTTQGFQKALARLPMVVLRALAAGVRQRLAALLDLTLDGFMPLGCDGTRLTCPRSEELERFLCVANKKNSAPSVWLTAVVHLRTGVPWCWWLGKGHANERWHLQKMIPWLPALTLLVADAGYLGYELMALLQQRVSFLIRGCSKAPLYTTKLVKLAAFREGECLYWPQEWQQKGAPPLRVRVLHLRKKKGHARGQDVWLITNVLDPKRLSWEQASKYYRWRWENEGFFRTYKRTLKKMKLESRTVALLHREAEGNMLALQLLLAMGALAQRGQATPPSSPRRLLLEVRQEIRAASPKGRRRSFGRRVREALRERRPRTSQKTKRPWPTREPHQAPKAPRFLKLTKALKAVLDQVNYAYD